MNIKEELSHDEREKQSRKTAAKYLAVIAVVGLLIWAVWSYISGLAHGFANS